MPMKQLRGSLDFQLIICLHMQKSYLFYLKDKKYIIYKNNDNIEKILSKVDFRNTMFETWIKANRKFDYARKHSYAKFLKQFVYHEDI